MPHKDAQVRIVGTQVWDPSTDNIDVEVILADGSRFGATFFTLENVRRLFHKNRVTGECAGGTYLWAADMILVEKLTMAAIQKTVEDLLNSGEFSSAFSKLEEP
jgi:hypothetical protein